MSGRLDPFIDAGKTLRESTLRALYCRSFEKHVDDDVSHRFSVLSYRIDVLIRQAFSLITE